MGPVCVWDVAAFGGSSAAGSSGGGSGGGSSGSSDGGGAGGAREAALGVMPMQRNAHWSAYYRQNERTPEKTTELSVRARGRLRLRRRRRRLLLLLCDIMQAGGRFLRPLLVTSVSPGVVSSLCGLISGG